MRWSFHEGIRPASRGDANFRIHEVRKSPTPLAFRGIFKRRFWGDYVRRLQARNEALRASKYLGRAIWRNRSGYHRRTPSEGTVLRQAGRAPGVLRGLVRTNPLEADRAVSERRCLSKRAPFKGFHSSPEIIRPAVMMYVRFPFSFRNVEDLLHERGIDIGHETERYSWNGFGPMFAAESRRKRVRQMRAYSNWRWHLDEVFVKIDGERHDMWRAVDDEGEVLESFATKRRDRKAALKFLKKSMKRYGRPHVLATDKLRSYGAALKDIGNADKQEIGRWLNIRAENSHLPFRRRERAMQRFRSMRSLQKLAAFIPPSATISIRSARSAAKRISRPTEPPLSPSGANSARHKGQLHCACRDWFAFV